MSDSILKRARAVQYRARQAAYGQYPVTIGGTTVGYIAREQRTHFRRTPWRWIGYDNERNEIKDATSNNKGATARAVAIAYLSLAAAKERHE